MSEMVERVALAVANGEIHGPNFDPFENPDTFAFCERIARTAIAAMREPTGPMVDAAIDSYSSGCEYTASWMAMIEAALGGKNQDLEGLLVPGRHLDADDLGSLRQYQLMLQEQAREFGPSIEDQRRLRQIASLLAPQQEDILWG